MKKFQFSLDTVLEYKQQVLDSLQAEHGALADLVRRQELTLAGVKSRYAKTNREYREKAAAGMQVAEAITYETGLQVLEREIFRETEKLQNFRRQADAKRREMVSAKQDTASIENLRERKLDSYLKEYRKREERFIDDLVCARGLSQRDATL